MKQKKNIWSSRNLTILEGKSEKQRVREGKGELGTRYKKGYEIPLIVACPKNIKEHVISHCSPLNVLGFKVTKKQKQKQKPAISLSEIGTDLEIDLGVRSPKY